MVGPPITPFQPYKAVHAKPSGPGDVRPTALQIVQQLKLENQLRGKTILITGCSSGVGVATAAALYETGTRLLLTARDMPKLEKVIDQIVAGSKISSSPPRPVAIEMHLDSLESVRKGAEHIKAKISTLNTLIANAGVMGSPYSKTVDGFERQMGTNHFSHFLLFSLLKDLMVKGAQESGTTSRVISLSSSGHWFGGIRFHDMHWTKQPVTYNKWQAYGQSKTANIYMANSITRRYGSKGLAGLSVHPGGIATELARHLSQSDFDDFGNVNELMHTYKSPEQGAATTVWAALSPHFEDVANGGRYLADLGESGPWQKGSHAADTGYEEWAYDEEKEERLWRMSCEAVGVEGD